MDEIAELHRRSARALVALMNGAPDAEFHIRAGCAMGLSGENTADLNMILLEGAETTAREFLAASMDTAARKRLPVLVQIAPALAEALASDAAAHGLTQAGALPLMVQRVPADALPSKPCEITEVRDPQAAAAAVALVSAAFSLPPEMVARALGSSALAETGCRFYLASNDGVAASSVAVTREGKVAGVWCMATPSERQGQGWGRALLSRAIDRLRDDGVERFYLFATAAGFPLYRSLGFETIAEEVIWVKGHSTQAHG
jgi:N-acetylglutamate synthase-like GNAT family acetyltransferase